MSSIVIAGDTSGTCTLQANAVAGTTTLTLPTTSGTLYAKAGGGAIGVADGGTGVTTLTGLAYGNGTSAFTAASAAQVVSVISTTAVANATYATTAGTATSATSATTATNVAGSGITGTQGIPRVALPVGSILQVVSTFDNTQYTFNSGSTSQTTYYDIAGLTATITPTSSTSKFLLIANITTGQTSGSYNNFLRFYRNSTAIALGNPSGFLAASTGGFRAFDGSQIGNISMSFLDSPATSSSITYNIKICNSGGSVSPSYINRPVSYTGWEQTGSSSFTVLEVSA